MSGRRSRLPSERSIRRNERPRKDPAKSMQTGNQSVATGSPDKAREKPALVEAIDFTLRTIETRARLYRNVLVAVALVSVGSVLASLIGWRVWPLAGLILIVPLA